MKRFYQILQMSRDMDSVKKFMTDMNLIGAVGGPDYDSYIYKKDGYVLVAAYRPLDDQLISNLMTEDVYKQLCKDADGKCFDLSLAYFAWTYGYGYYLNKDNISPISALQDTNNHVSLKDKAARIGELQPTLYVVTMTEQQEEILGTTNTEYIIGLSDDVRQAEYFIERVSAEKPTSTNRKYTISPVKVNTVLNPEDRPIINR